MRCSLPNHLIKEKTKENIFMKKSSISTITRLAAVAAMYVALTYVFSALSFGMIQFRDFGDAYASRFLPKGLLLVADFRCAIANLLFSPMMALAFYLVQALL